MNIDWVKAFELPSKITGAVFAASITIYLLNRYDHLDLISIGSWVPSTVLIVAISSGFLFLFSAAFAIGEAVRKYLARRDKINTETTAKIVAISHLDRLSEQENYLVVQALKENSPSFTSWVHASGSAPLVSKGLLVMHDGQYMKENWPYTFRDFAWEEILKRKKYFFEKEKQYEANRRC